MLKLGDVVRLHNYTNRANIVFDPNTPIVAIASSVNFKNRVIYVFSYDNGYCQYDTLHNDILQCDPNLKTMADLYRLAERNKQYWKFEILIDGMFFLEC